MPHVQITWGEGRSPEQKRIIAEAVTKVLVDNGGVKRQNVHVAFHDLAETNYANAGVLVCDRPDRKGKK